MEQVCDDGFATRKNMAYDDGDDSGGGGGGVVSGASG